MTDLERILQLWREAETSSADFVLATVVAVEGSSYRKPGASMLIAADGRRAGTVSGGCLEAQVASRAWWLTANGPTIQRFSTQEEDGERPYGSGCGGVVYLLMERRATANARLAALEESFRERIPLAIGTVLDGPRMGNRSVAGLTKPGTSCGPLGEFAEAVLVSATSMERTILLDGRQTRAWAEYRQPRPGLRIFGAGDDAQPLVNLAKELGWFVSVADGRSHLAIRARFPRADEIGVLSLSADARQLAGEAQGLGSFQDRDAAVLMTHSFEQDAFVLAALLSRASMPAYIGVLGPHRRTRELLADAARQLGVAEEKRAQQAEEWLGLLHAPTGLDLGAESPAAIALSILAEIQQTLAGATALPLGKVRAAR